MSGIRTTCPRTSSQIACTSCPRNWLSHYFNSYSFCVLYVFYKTPRLRSVTSYYIITLAISDVILSILLMPISIVQAAVGRDAIGYQIGQVAGFAGFSFVFGSLQTTSLIAVNRFFCVVKPMLYRKYFKPKPATLMIISTWVVSIAFIALFYIKSISALQVTTRVSSTSNATLTYSGFFMSRDQIQITRSLLALVFGFAGYLPQYS